MNHTLRNILAIIAGLIAGSIVNGAIISVSHIVTPPPKGIDVSTYEGLLEAIPLFEPKHYLMPFLAHALGAFSGTILGTLLVNKYRWAIGLIIGFFFMIGGIINVFIIPAPLWFSIIDISLAYIPVARLAVFITNRKREVVN